MKNYTPRPRDYVGIATSMALWAIILMVIVAVAAVALIGFTETMRIVEGAQAPLAKR